MIPKTKNPKPEMALRLQKQSSEASAKRLINALELGRFFSSCPFSSGGLQGGNMIGLQPMF
jgi:hypothetical protein